MTTGYRSRLLQVAAPVDLGISSRIVGSIWRVILILIFIPIIAVYRLSDYNSLRAIVAQYRLISLGANWSIIIYFIAIFGIKAIINIGGDRVWSEDKRQRITSNSETVYRYE